MPNLSSLTKVPTMDDPAFFELLKDALPFIAKVTGGYATITDAYGMRLYTVDSEGNEPAGLVGVKYKAVEPQGMPHMAASDIVSEAESWVLPLGPYMLACSNIERVQRDQQLFEALHQAMPVIARIMGGEAVLFDVNGRRLVSYAYDGVPNSASIGKQSTAAAEAMRTNRPTVGPSTSVEGAVAVRFPVTPSFGFGFNNEQTVKREKSLLDEVRKSSHTRYSFVDIDGDSKAICTVKEFAKSLSAGDSSILIYGETGTGKELFAQAIHTESSRRNKPFIAINCAALPASIIESYLFGHEEGAFTGARKGGSSGAFEDANGGTLFLDEVSEMDFSLQNKILRALQEREIIRIGSSKPIPVNIRVLSATNRDLRAMVENKEFRADLYYRLNVVQLTIPPLRERQSDITVLVRSFISRNNSLFGKFVFSVAPEAMGMLLRHNWTGNVRELQNCIEHAFNMLTPKEQTILPVHLPRYLLDTRDSSNEKPFLRGIGKAHDVFPNADRCTLKESLLVAERKSIEEALAFCGGNRQRTAAMLDISTTTLWRRMCAVGLGTQDATEKNSISGR